MYVKMVAYQNIVHHAFWKLCLTLSLGWMLSWTQDDGALDLDCSNTYSGNITQSGFVGSKCDQSTALPKRFSKSICT